MYDWNGKLKKNSVKIKTENTAKAIYTYFLTKKKCAMINPRVKNQISARFFNKRPSKIQNNKSLPFFLLFLM